MKLFTSIKICTFSIIVLNSSLIFAGKFTPEQKTEAVQLAGETQSFIEVERRLGIDRRSVRLWVRAEEQRTGRQIVAQKPREYFTSEQRARVVQMRKEGQSYREVARKMNIPRSNVQFWSNRYEINVQELKEAIENIALSSPSIIPDVLNNIIDLISRHLRFISIFLKATQNEFLNLLEDAEQKLSLDKRIDLKTRTEIDLRMQYIKDILSSNPCQGYLLQAT